jgi:hypothetical protein
MMHIVYYTDTGVPFSIGSVLAEPMPAEFSVYDCTDAEAVGLVDGTLMWDADSRTVVERPAVVWPDDDDAGDD